MAGCADPSPRFGRVGRLALFALCLGSVGCFPAVPAPDGSCTLLVNDELDCSAPGYDSQTTPAGLVAYGCSGSARPDQNGTFIQGVPRGLVCADRGSLPGEDRLGYCCTPAPTDCAFDPVSDCVPPDFGYQCRGWNRPESLNPAVSCTNGNPDGDLIDYCCTGMPVASGCMQSNFASCSARMLGFLCKLNARPSGEDLGPNLSRADYVHPVCSTPAAAPNADYESECCYMPAPLPIGASCVNHMHVPGCASGRFGFACYGPDTPEDDYLPMRCPDPPSSGLSAEGYPARLYCCDFE